MLLTPSDGDALENALLPLALWQLLIGSHYTGKRRRGETQSATYTASLAPEAAVILALWCPHR